MSNTPQEPTRALLTTLFIAAFAAMFALTIFGLQPLADGVYWWHIALGEFIASWQRIPDQQLFVSTAAETPWVYSSWMGSLALFHLHYFAGAELPLLVHNIFAALSVGVVAFTLARRHNSLLAILASTIFLSLALTFFTSVSPFSLALPIFTIAFLILIDAFQDRTRVATALVLPLSVALLANIDLISALIIALFSIAAGIRTWKSHRKESILSLLAPFGLLLFAYGPTYIFSALQDTSAALPPVLLTVSLVLSMALAIIVSRRLPAGEFRVPKTPIAAAFLTLSTIAIALQPGVPTRTKIYPLLHDDVRIAAPMASVLPKDFPLRCAEELNRIGRPLRLFHDERHAGFLLYHLYDHKRPQPLLFHDHRALLSPEIKDLIPLFKTDPIGRGVFQQFGVNAVIVDRDDYPALVQELDAAPDWTDLDEYLNDGFACFIPVSWEPDE